MTGVLVNDQVSLGSNRGNSVPLVSVQSIDARMKNAMGSYGEGVIGLAFEGGMDQCESKLGLTRKSLKLLKIEI